MTGEELSVLSAILPHFGVARSRAHPLEYRVRQRIAVVHGAVARGSAKTDTCLGR